MNDEKPIFDEDNVSDEFLTSERLENENDKKVMSFKTEHAKNQFIEEITNGLGAEIKKNSKKIIKKKDSIGKRLGNFFKRMFTSF